MFIKKTILVGDVSTQSPFLSAKNIMNTEGRIVRAEFPEFVLIHVYIPNSGRGGDFLKQRVAVEKEIRKMLAKETKPIVYCGDLNVVTAPIDIFNWEGNLGKAGMTEEERTELEQLKSELHLVDAFRTLNPELVKYSWFKNFGTARKENKGWRIDYFLVSESFMKNVSKCDIFDDVKDLSDHCPILLELQFK